MRTRYLLGLGAVIILASVTFAFAQTTGSFVSFVQPPGATNKPTLALTLFTVMGCSEIDAVAVDSLGRPHMTGTTTGCDNGGLFIAGPDYLYVSYTVEGGLYVSNLGINFNASGNLIVAGTVDYRSPWGWLDAVNALPGCHLDESGRLLDRDFQIEITTGGRIISATCVLTQSNTNAGTVVVGNRTTALDTAGNVYSTTEFVTGDGVTTKTSPSGSLIYSVPIGGAAITADTHGGAYIIGRKRLTTEPDQLGDSQTGDLIYTQLGPTGELVYSMYITLDRGSQGVVSINVDSLGTVYVVGNTDSSTFPTTDGSVCASLTPLMCLGGSGYFGVIGPYTTASVSHKNRTFGTQRLSTTSEPKRITLFNTGTAQMTVSGLRISGDYYIQTNDCGNGVEPGTHCDVYVVFTPTASGEREGILTFTDNAASSPQVVMLRGHGHER